MVTQKIWNNKSTFEKTETSNERKFARSTVDADHADWIEAETDTDVVVLSFVLAGAKKSMWISTESLLPTVTILGENEATNDLSSDTRIEKVLREPWFLRSTIIDVVSFGVKLKLLFCTDISTSNSWGLITRDSRRWMVSPFLL